MKINESKSNNDKDKIKVKNVNVWYGDNHAIKNVTLPMTFKGIPKYIRIERARTIINNLGLKDFCNHYPNELSAGEQQRIAIARALANNPEIILADEPTGNLDTTTGNQIMNILSSLNDEKKTILLVTHDLSLTKYSDKYGIFFDSTRSSFKRFLSSLLSLLSSSRAISLI